MKLSLSIAAESRDFGKAIRRVRPSLNPLIVAFEAFQPRNPIHETLLIGITDGLPHDAIQVIPNRDGFFQVLCGFPSASDFSARNDPTIKHCLVQIILAAVAACPFSSLDKAEYLRIVEHAHLE
jgi:hypothetical protein